MRSGEIGCYDMRVNYVGSLTVFLKAKVVSAGFWFLKLVSMTFSLILF